MRAFRPAPSRTSGRRALVYSAAVLVGGAVLTLSVSGEPGDTGLAVAFLAVAVLCLPCMVVWLIRGGPRR